MLGKTAFASGGTGDRAATETPTNPARDIDANFLRAGSFTE
jgi:hypothetical protein